MDTTAGVAQVASTLASLNSTAAQIGLFRRFVSAPLAAQTLGSATVQWAVSIAGLTSNASNSPWHLSPLYLGVWRPSTGAVVGTFFTTSQSLGATGVAAGIAEGLLTPSLGASFGGTTTITCQDGDVLVLELGATCTQGMGTSYTWTLDYDGTTDGSITSNAAFLVSPTTLTFFVPPGPYAYVVVIGGVNRIDLPTFTLAGTTLTVAGGAYQIAIDPTGTYAYVLGNSASTVTKINLSTLTKVGSAIGVAASPYRIAIDPAGTYAYVVNNDISSNTVNRIDLSTFTTAGTVLTATSPADIAIDPAGTYAYVPGGGTATKIDLSTFTKVGSALAVGGADNAIAIDPAGTYAYVVNGNTVNTITKIDLSTFTTVGSALAVGATPVAIAIDPAGTYAYVVNNNTNPTVTKINLSTFATVGSALSIVGGAAPSEIIIDPAGTYAYVVNSSPSTVTKIDLSTFTMVGSDIAVGHGPYDIAIAPSTSRPKLIIVLQAVQRASFR